MKNRIIILILSCLAFTVQAQVAFKTVVPQQPVTLGESFQVQYIIEDAEKVSMFLPPAFKNFRPVTGPNTYTGSVSSLNKIKQLRNTVYTLLALQTGRFIIPGATANVNGKAIRSNDALVEVISKEEAAKRFLKDAAATNSAYFLAPGEDPYDKISKNLFLKVMVDRRACFVGEPVLATFKLYSRLESRSDIVKNPGFYGFTVYDMVNLADKEVNSENVNGQLFDVHTIRKVQLYPLQAGVFTVDAMEVKNKVVFSRSVINKKTEQEIVEGILGNTNNESPVAGTEVFESNISTEPVTITVKPAPVKNKPGIFSGATGNFTISAAMEKSVFTKNEEGFLEIVIRGKGNFIQLNAPLVQWPAGIEGFEPVIKDSLIKTQSPLSGHKSFRYGFVSARAGHFTISPVSISFFNPDSGTYKTITTEPTQFTISNEENPVPVIPQNVISKNKKEIKNFWLIGGTTLLVLGTLTWFIRNRKKKTVPDQAKVEKIRNDFSVDQAFVSASLLMQADDRSFYNSLYQSVWRFFTYHLKLSGSGINKENLLLCIKEYGVHNDDLDEIRDILEQCEKGMFTSAELKQDKTALMERTKEILQRIERKLL